MPAGTTRPAPARTAEPAPASTAEPGPASTTRPTAARTVRPAAASQDAVRRHNLGTLLRLVHVRGATSRSDLVALTGLNRSTVKALTDDLTAAGLVRQTAPVGRGMVGRPSLTVEPASTAVDVLALDIGVEHLTAVRVGLGGVVLDRRELRQQPGDYDLQPTLRRLAGMVRQLEAGRPRSSTTVGIGVGVCGVVSADDGVVRFAPNLGWVDVPLLERLAAELGTDLPIALGNDGDLGLLAEHVRGAAVGYADVLYVSGEVGVGGGVLVDGRPMRGAGGYGGEVGHMTVDPNGRTCRCGRRGCWETEIGDEAVLRATGAPDGATLDDVLTAWTAGEEWTQAGMRRVGTALGVGVTNLVNVFNPQLVLFGGVSRQVFAVTEPLVRAALAAALEAPREQVQLAGAGLGDDSVVLGAAEMAFAPLLGDPLAALSALRRTA